jgi:flagellar basal-body rod modification protein FlgD
MTDISPSSPANTVVIPSTTPSTGSASPGGLGKQDFLKLLMAQLRNQDPLKPMEDTQMIAQMAQFSALEATQGLTSVLQQSSNMQTVIQAGSLIGKYVQAERADGTTISGAVAGVSFESTDGLVAPSLLVGTQVVDYSDVRRISSTPVGTSSSAPSNTPTSNTAGTSSNTSAVSGGSSPTTPTTNAGSTTPLSPAPAA